MLLVTKSVRAAPKALGKGLKIGLKRLKGIIICGCLSRPQQSKQELRWHGGDEKRFDLRSEVKSEN